MSTTILKYPLLHGRELALPEGFIARRVAMQHGRDMLWAEVDPDAPVKHYLAVKVGTGKPIPPGAVYLGTLLEQQGSFVWHFYAEPA